MFRQSKANSYNLKNKNFVDTSKLMEFLGKKTINLN